MTAVETNAFARVVVIAPSTRVDLALPADVPVADLLPMLLDLVGEHSDDGGSRHGGWRLSQVGAGELAGDRTLRALEIVDGASLHLTPRESDVVAPIYDDAVDAIAATIRAGTTARSTNPAAGAAAVVAGLASAALALFFSGGGGANTALAVLIMLIALGVGAAIARGPGNAIMATATAAGGLAFAFVSGVDIVPGTVGRSSLLLGFALMLVYSVFAMAALGTGTVVFVATMVVSTFGTVAALVATEVHMPALFAYAGVAALGVAAVAVLPWFVVRLARLPLPLVPTSSADIRRDDAAEIDIAEVTARARLADEFLTGSVLGCAASTVFAAVVVAAHGSVLSSLLAVACVGALLMRVRTITGLVPRAAIIALTLAGLVAGSAVEVTVARHDSRVVVGLGLVAALAGVLLSVVVPRLRVSPVTRRFVDFVEALLLVAILPLAIGVMNLYSTMRHL